MTPPAMAPAGGGRRVRRDAAEADAEDTLVLSAAGTTTVEFVWDPGILVVNTELTVQVIVVVEELLESV